MPDTHPKGDDPSIGKCARCGGPIFRHKAMDYPHEPRGPWLHRRLEDWEKDEHDAVHEEASR